MHRVGSYLDREVDCVDIESRADFGGLVVDDALVLIDVAAADLGAEERIEFAELILAQGPLAVFFTGPHAEVLFDDLLHVLDKPDSRHTMTNFSLAVLPEAVEDFLIATLPAEECWEQWRRYVLVATGGRALELERAARSVTG